MARDCDLPFDLRDNLFFMLYGIGIGGGFGLLSFNEGGGSVGGGGGCWCAGSVGGEDGGD